MSGGRGGGRKKEGMGEFKKERRKGGTKKEEMEKGKVVGDEERKGMKERNEEG